MHPSAAELHSRVKERGLKGGHFMPPELLDSQLDTLEFDSDAMVFGKLAAYHAISLPATCLRTFQN